ncbi:MAG: 2-C-methyl-D-erythritol 2,4-cyclodiphosphate synthase [Holosporales bacterium]|nr:2-C-methyl-D-erythritol 2,4-cyclodiphosphate synthase [Holosporales bacterium]
MHGIYAIVLAAGRGSRFGVDSPGLSVPKQFHRIDGEVILKKSVNIFLLFEDIAGVLCVIPHEFFGLFYDIFGAENDPRLLGAIPGGNSRLDSAKNGLDYLAQFSPDYVLIHDAVRCHCQPHVLEDLLAAIGEGKDAVIPVVNPIDSVRLQNKPCGSIDREDIYLVQTPQAFKFNLIHGLYGQHAGLAEIFHDDASLCDIAGIPVSTVRGSHLNRKITFREDIYRQTSIIKTGFGYDAHRFSRDADRNLYLMGVLIEDHPGLDGHSDADVGIHSIVDAILGALCLGSIGEYFPSDNPMWKDADSQIFLTHCRELLHKSSAEIINIDSTIVCESPRITPYSTIMKQTIASCLGISASAINIKGKTTDGMDFTGRKEGIAAYSIVTIRAPAGACDIGGDLL